MEEGYTALWRQLWAAQLALSWDSASHVSSHAVTLKPKQQVHQAPPHQ